jgi:hypothetical protein
MAELAANPTTSVALVPEVDVTGGQVVVGSVTTAGRIRLPQAGFREPIVGVVARPDGSTATSASGRAVSVQFTGTARVRALTGTSIAVGDTLVVASTAGEVAPISLALAQSAVVGIALSAVTTAVSGQMVLVLLIPEATNSMQIVPMVANAAIGANLIVVAGGADLRVILPAGADPTSGVLGVSLTAAAGAASPLLVCTKGPASLISGGNLTLGANVAVFGAAGSGKVAAPGAGTNTHCVGTALQATVAPAQGLVMVNPFMFQG